MYTFYNTWNFYDQNSDIKRCLNFWPEKEILLLNPYIKDWDTQMIMKFICQNVFKGRVGDEYG